MSVKSKKRRKNYIKAKNIKNNLPKHLTTHRLTMKEAKLINQ